jgi:hypothetical protein
MLQDGNCYVLQDPGNLATSPLLYLWGNSGDKWFDVCPAPDAQTGFAALGFRNTVYCLGDQHGGVSQSIYASLIVPELPEGQLPGEGETIEGQVEGEIIEGQQPEGNLPEGETIDGETVEGEVDGESPEGQVSDGEIEGAVSPQGEPPTVISDGENTPAPSASNDSPGCFG